jgi:Uma2 family endonuclease
MATEVLSSFHVPPRVLARLGTRMSDEELMRFSQENTPYRFERTRDGEITIMSPVGGIGSMHEALVFHALYTWNLGHARGIAFSQSAGFNLPDGSCLAPHAAWLSISRWNALTPRQQEGFPPLCPEFVIEVRSASDARRPLELKMEQWIENGAQLAWLIEPALSSVTIYRLDRPATVAAPEPVEGFQLVCDGLWPSR